MQRSPAVEGSPSAKIVIVGEAPSYMELKMGRPFVGPAGDVLNTALHAASIARGQIYIVNTWPFAIKKEVRGNSEHIYYEGELLWKSGSGITERGLELAAPTLERISECSANVIVPVGQIATDLVAGKPAGMMKWRGSILQGHARVDRRKVIPSVHPAAIVRGAYIWRYLLINDLQRAKEEMDDPRIADEGIHYILEPTADQVLSYIETCRTKGIVATDIEIINHQVSCLCLCFSPEQVMVVPFVHPKGGDYYSLEDEMRIWRAYGSLLTDQTVAKINQNMIGFDAPFLLYQNNIHTRGPIGDTMIAQHIMYPEFPKGLDFITSIHTRIPYYKDEGKMWRAPNDWEMFWRYNGKDGVSALIAWFSLEKEMRDTGFLHTYEMTVEMADPLMYMATIGLRIDKEALDATKKDIEGQILEAEAELDEAADYPFNPGSHKQCKEYFYEHKGCTPYKNSRGAVTADDKAMSRIYRKYHLPEAKLVQRIRSLKKLKSTYLMVETDEDGRIRCSWNPRGTWTGRLSSSQTVRGTGMNLQNLDPRFKGFIIADEDSHV